VFNQFGDLERCALRPGNVHSADGWDAVLKPVVARYRGKISRIYFRADAGFANPEVFPASRARVPWLSDTEREMPAEYEPTADQRALRVKPSSN